MEQSDELLDVDRRDPCHPQVDASRRTHRMIVIVPYNADWPERFLQIGRQLRQALGRWAVRIDHIGSTAVPGLAAKDIIDVQVSVEALDPAIEQAVGGIGYARVEGISADHVPAGRPASEGAWEKWIFKPRGADRPAHVHVRVIGRPNQRYAVLFRDFLRTHPAEAQSYALVKAALATYHADDPRAYYDVKDPVCDVIMGAAEAWAESCHWEAGPSDC